MALADSMVARRFAWCCPFGYPRSYSVGLDNGSRLVGLMVDECRVYWGSHGCGLKRGHDGPHFCCCDCVNHPDADSGCVGKTPYYGDKTTFYDEDFNRLAKP